MGNEITSAGNILFAVTSLIGIICFHRWEKGQVITDNTRTVLRAWQLKDAAVFLRISWWILALLTAPEGETYAAFFVENKHFITLPTSLMYLYGQFLFIQHIDNHSDFKRLGWMFGTVLAAIGILWMGF